MADNWKRPESVARGEPERSGVRQDLPAASSAGGAGWSTSGSRPRRPQESEPAEDPATARRYVEAVLDRYLWLPGTPRVASRHDRRCAQTLFERGVPLEVVNAALLLATTRRTFRTGDALPPVRALHYFLPVIDELQEPELRKPRCDLGYIRHLEHKLEPLAAAKTRPPGGWQLQR